jgi:UDP-N-acetylmuramoyl-tripeptide--D-alanyl-D-alanine ligase
MSLWKTYQVAAATNGVLQGDGETPINGLSIDTRSLREGDLFVALKAERDGHEFLQQAFEKGAAAALVSKPVEGGGPQIVAGETLSALERLAETARDRSFAPLVGVTGSAGKTTTKEMLRFALSPLGKVHAAVKSFNNHIGVPLTLAELPPEADAGVFEMGMNHAGEIRGLTTLVRPHVALITTIAEAHLEFLGSMEAIADAKAEIAEGLREGGVMILPADSPYIERLEKRCREAGVEALRYFGKAGEDGKLIAAEPCPEGLKVRARIAGQEVAFTLRAQGQHMASNAVAALLAASLCGVEPAEAAKALESFASGEGRGARFRLKLGDKTVTILDESYNANPASMRASLSVLAHERGRRIAVLGEMKELGETAPALHAGLADDAAAAADVIHTAGPLMAHLRDSLPPEKRGTHTDEATGLVQVLLTSLNEADTVLFKGSNASRVGALVESLVSAGQKV